mgnify:CR=1 FL=1
MTAATLFLVGCGQRQHTEQVTLVRIDTVKTANTCDILEFPARVQAAGEVHLAFKIPGTLQRIYVDDGAFVRQGELVAEMDPRDYELQLQAVEAEYLSIKAEAEPPMLTTKRDTGCNRLRRNTRTPATNWPIRNCMLLSTAT